MSFIEQVLQITAVSCRTFHRCQKTDGCCSATRASGTSPWRSQRTGEQQQQTGCSNRCFMCGRQALQALRCHHTAPTSCYISATVLVVCLQPTGCAAAQRACCCGCSSMQCSQCRGLLVAPMLPLAAVDHLCTAACAAPAWCWMWLWASTWTRHSSRQMCSPGWRA
jgi:hypothetical protein